MLSSGRSLPCEGAMFDLRLGRQLSTRMCRRQPAWLSEAPCCAAAGRGLAEELGARTMTSPGRVPPPPATATTPQGTGGAVRLSPNPAAQRLTGPTAADREAARTLRAMQPLQREAPAEQASPVAAARDGGGAVQHDAGAREGSARKAQGPGSGPGK